MKHILLFSLSIFFACTSEKQKQINLIKSGYQNYINDVAFKNNSSVNVLRLDVISIDTLNENTYDSLEVYRHLKVLNDFDEKGKDVLESLNSNKNLAIMARKLGSDSYDHFVDYARSDSRKAMAIKDSMTKYLEIINAIDEKIKKRKNPKPVYEVKLFLKAEFLENNKKSNFMDSTVVFFDNTYKLL